MTSGQLEDSLSVAPQKEYSLFRNRDKFDLVVLYDTDSGGYGSAISPMSAVVRIIYETAFQRILKRNPVLLVGGLRAWKIAYPSELTQETDALIEKTLDGPTDDLMQRAERLKLTPSPASSNSTSIILSGSASIANGSISNYASTNGVNGINGMNGTNGLADVSTHEIWIPTRPRSGTDASTTSSIINGSTELPWTRPQYTMGQIPENERYMEPLAMPKNFF